MKKQQQKIILVIASVKQSGSFGVKILKEQISFVTTLLYS